MASNGEIDYTSVLADLIEKRDRLNAAINGIQAMLGIQGLASTPSTATKPENSQELGEGAFLGMSIADAAKKLMAARRKNMRTEEIYNELKAGGLVFSGDSPVNSVGSVLNRTFSTGGDIVRVSRGVWGLADWHPRMRKRPTPIQNGAVTGEDLTQAPDDGNDLL